MEDLRMTKCISYMTKQPKIVSQAEATGIHMHLRV